MPDAIAIITDVFFQMRVAAAARAAGRSVQFCATLSTVEALTSGTLVLVDLDAELDVIQAIKVMKGIPNTTVVAFGPHVDSAHRKAARLAGADRVMAKSKFVAELPLLLARRGESLPQ